MLLICAYVHADYVRDGDSERWGHIVSTSGTDLIIAPGCQNNSSLKLKKNQLLRIELNSDCKSKLMPKYASGLADDCDNPFKGFVVTIDGLDDKPFVADFNIDNETKISLLRHDGTLLLVDRSKIRSLVAAQRCKLTNVSNEPTGNISEGVCLEPRQWAVNFSGNAVSRNQIFTKGFSMYVSGLDNKHNILDIRQSFGYAITLWASALLRIRAELPPELKTFIEKSFQCGPSACILTPPQVIQRYCQQTAMFLVKWIEHKGDEFKPDETTLLAKSQVEGRTVLINAADHQFVIKVGGPPRLQENQYNLINVLAHELGHAFGLPDRFDGLPSIMSASIRKMSKEPTDDDAHRLAKVLEQEIKGSPPGEINFAGCRGLNE